MGNRIANIKAFIKGATTLSSSRWGIFNTLLAVSAILIAIGAWCDMNWIIGLGLGIGILAIIIGVIWLVRGSKDPTAMKDDIDKLGTRIETAINNQTQSRDPQLDRIINLLEHKGDEDEHDSPTTS